MTGKGVWCGFNALLILAMIAGCSQQLSEIPQGEANIQDLGRWYQDYRAANGRKHPPNEQAFVTFITNRSKKTGETVDPQKLLTSPRDGQKYVVTYGKPTSSDFNASVVAYEKEGYDGKKWVVFESKATEEVDDAGLQTILARK